MTPVATLILIWLAVGGVLAVVTPSRGVVADLLFVVTWPFLLHKHLWGGRE